MKKQVLFAGIATACLIVSGAAYATDLYVSISTGNNKNEGTKEAPLKNIWKAIENAEPGDTIHVAAGNYPGKMSCGWIEMNKPVKLIGGYSPDFSERDPIKLHTMLRPTNAQNATKPQFGTLTITADTFGADAEILIDGIIFDHTQANSYHPAEGKPEGFENGMLTIPPAKGKTQYPSIDSYLLHAKTDGTLTIQNCLFINGCNYAVNVSHRSGKVNVKNNVFIGNRMMGADVRSSNAKLFEVEYEFAYNTVLFTWTRTKSFEDMGYGVRTERGVASQIHHNILGLNCMAGFDNSKGDAKEKKVALDDNVFFLNKRADVAVTISPHIKFMKVDDEGFEDLADLDGMESVSNNIGLKDPAVFKGVIDAAYLEAFLNATYSETTDYEENSPENTLREALGLNKRGTITTKVSMFANPYPFDDSLKFFGAMEGYGAQAIK